MTLTEQEIAETALERAIIHDLGQCGRYLHMNAGGRGGQMPVLSRLYLAGGSMSQAALGEHFSLKSGSLSEVISKRECEGLVTRTRSEGDRRKATVTLTEAGTARAEEHIRFRQEFERNAFACLSDAEKTQLKDMLSRVVTHWEAM